MIAWDLVWDVGGLCRLLDAKVGLYAGDGATREIVVARTVVTKPTFAA